MHALKHPVRENRLLAIRLLGRLRTAAALPHFERLLETEEDVYVLLEVLQALCLMETPESQKLLAKTAIWHKAELVRRQAQRLLMHAQKETH